MLIEKDIRSFIDSVDQDSATPGGGSVAALASSLGISLGRMVQHLTINKKKFNNLDEEIKNNYMECFGYLKNYKESMISLIDEDTKAYDLVMSAYKLPKETQEQQEVRDQQIQSAIQEAIRVPFKVLLLSNEALKCLTEMVPYSNQNAISDIGVGALLLSSGAEGAFMNVLINLSTLKDTESIKRYQYECDLLMSNINTMKKDILNGVYEQIQL